MLWRMILVGLTLLSVGSACATPVDEESQTIALAEESRTATLDEERRTATLEGSGPGLEYLTLGEGMWTVHVDLKYNEICFEGECRVMPFGLTFAGRNDTKIALFYDSRLSENHPRIGDHVYCLSAAARFEVSPSALSPGLQTLAIDAQGDWVIDIYPTTEAQLVWPVNQTTGFVESDKLDGTERKNLLC